MNKPDIAGFLKKGDVKIMEHASHDTEKSTGINAFYTICGVILSVVIGGPFLYAMMFLLNQ